MAVLSKEPSFNQLCRLISKAPDNDETASKINDLLNSLYEEYSELMIFRALTKRFRRSAIHHQNVKSVKPGAAHKRQGRKRGDRKNLDPTNSNDVVACGEAAGFGVLLSNNVIEFARGSGGNESVSARMS